jgi:thymidylate kinase
MTGPGWFLALEGIDGAGKTTAVAGVAALLRERGEHVAVLEKHSLEFGSPYVAGMVGRVRDLIWGRSPADRYLELGDYFWVHLQAAWYEAVAHTVVRPRLEAGHTVVTDTWTSKFVAKLAMRPDIDLGRVHGAFAGLPVPDLVVRLDLAAHTAASRRSVFSASEAGNHEGDVDRSAAAFVEYQTRLAVVLDGFGEAGGWSVLDVNGLGKAATAAALLGLIDALAPPGGPR